MYVNAGSSFTRNTEEVVWNLVGGPFESPACVTVMNELPGQTPCSWYPKPPHISQGLLGPVVEYTHAHVLLI